MSLPDTVKAMELELKGSFNAIELTDMQAYMYLNDIPAPYLLNERDDKCIQTFIMKAKTPLKDHMYAFYHKITEENARKFVDALAIQY